MDATAALPCLADGAADAGGWAAGGCPSGRCTATCEENDKDGAGPLGVEEDVVNDLEAAAVAVGRERLVRRGGLVALRAASAEVDEELARLRPWLLLKVEAAVLVVEVEEVEVVAAEALAASELLELEQAAAVRELFLVGNLRSWAARRLNSAVPAPPAREPSSSAPSRPSADEEAGSRPRSRYDEPLAAFRRPGTGRSAAGAAARSAGAIISDVLTARRSLNWSLHARGC